MNEDTPPWESPTPALQVLPVSDTASHCSRCRELANRLKALRARLRNAMRAARRLGP